MQTTVQKKDAVRFWSGILSISTDNGSSWTNLWALKEAKINIDKTIKEMVFDNAKMPPKAKINEVIFSATLFEIALENLQSIDGLAEYSTSAGTQQTITGEVLGTGWTIGTPLRLTNKNADGTKVSSISIKAGSSTLTSWTDYDTYIYEGYTFILPKTAQTGSITAGYKYTPVANKTQIYKDVEKYLAMNMFKFANVNDEWKEFAIIFEKGYNRAGLEAQFQADESEDTMWVGIEIKAYPTASNELFRIIDEQDVV